MAQTSFVLQALGILGPEEMLKISEVLKAKQIPLKKAAGAESVIWDEAPSGRAPTDHLEAPEAKILEFPKKTIREFDSYQEPPPEIPEEQEGSLLSTELMLWQREIARENGKTVHQLDAFKGYQKSTQVYVVKTHEPEGKNKIRFASTQGVLVNKKQA